jgi:GNAT superfamily N-acetyltransferase
MAADQRDVLGAVDIELADVVGDWQRPSFDVATGTVGVFEDGRMVGYAEVAVTGRGYAAVLPSHRRRGIGSWLAQWMEHTGAAIGAQVVSSPLPQGSPGDLLLEARGYRLRWHSWILEMPPGKRIVDRPLPPGHVARAADPSEYRALHDVFEDAFLEWSERDREPYEEFEATSVRRPGFEPWHLRVVVDDTGAVVAAAQLSVFRADHEEQVSVARLATRRDQRGRGLAQCLLADSFAAGRERGVPGATLSTDSRTGALGLYERVGMVVTSTWVNRAIDV